jgi:hypothetical protein
MRRIPIQGGQALSGTKGGEVTAPEAKGSSEQTGPAPSQGQSKQG